MHVACARSALTAQMLVAAVTGKVACVQRCWSWEGHMTAGHVHRLQDDSEHAVLSSVSLSSLAASVSDIQ